MTTTFRVIDTGIDEGRRNIAFDAALIELHREGLIGNTIRLLQFTPTALVGRHQALSRELKLEYCAANGIGIARRITGGGALYMDEGQLGLELVFDRQALGLRSLVELSQAICEAVALGLRNLGVPARYRPRNDIEVHGRKIGGSGGFFEGDTVFFQCTVLAAMDASRMLAALNVPQAKLAKRALDSAQQRVVTLQELLGAKCPPMDMIKRALVDRISQHFGFAVQWEAVSGEEQSRTDQLFREDIGTEDFVRCIDDPDAPAEVHTGSHTGAGGTVTAHLRLEGPRQDRIREVLITGDFFVTPPRTILDLEARLRGLAIADMPKTIESFFEQGGIGVLSAGASDFVSAIRAAHAAFHANRHNHEPLFSAPS